MSYLKKSVKKSFTPEELLDFFSFFSTPTSTAWHEFEDEELKPNFVKNEQLLVISQNFLSWCVDHSERVFGGFWVPIWLA